MSKRLPIAAAVIAAACVLGGGATSAQAGTVVTTQNFTGDSTANWGWETKTDTNNQLSGTDQLTYNYNAAGSNVKGYVRNTITDAATLFPNGTGSITMHLHVNLSNYSTGTSDFGGPSLMELGNSQGNKSSFTGGGMISRMAVVGWNSPGQFRFSLTNSLRFSNGASGFSNAFTVGASPAFPLIYDLTMTTTVTGAPGAWTIVTSGTAVGPTNTSGTIGTITIAPATFNTALTWTGLKEANAYNVGIVGAGNAVAVGKSITLDTFTVDPVPEPAAIGLLGASAMLLGMRRRSNA